MCKFKPGQEVTMKKDYKEFNWEATYIESGIIYPKFGKIYTVCIVQCHPRSCVMSFLELERNRGWDQKAFEPVLQVSIEELISPEEPQPS